MPHDDRALPTWLDLVPASASPAPSGIVVSGVASRTRPGLFAEWAGALGFPAYFGHNWDAFADCLTDLAWPDLEPAPEALTIVIEGAEHVLADEPLAQLTTFLEILDDVATGRNLGRPASPGTPPRLRIAVRYGSKQGLRRWQAAGLPTPLQPETDLRDFRAYDGRP